MADHDYLLKILLVGASGVGKSCLLLRYADATYTDSFLSTIGVDFKIVRLDTNVDGNDKVIKLQIWDTAGQERFRTITSSYYRGAQAIIVCTDASSSDTEVDDQARFWHGEIVRYACENVTTVLCVTKIDLVDQKLESRARTEKMQEVADKCGMVLAPFCSAKTGENVNEVFHLVAEKVLEKIERVAAKYGPGHVYLDTPLPAAKTGAIKKCC